MPAGTSLLGGGLQLGSVVRRPATRQLQRLRRAAAARRPPPVSRTQALQPGPITAPVERALEAALRYVLPSASLGEVENMAVGMALGGTLLLILRAGMKVLDRGVRDVVSCFPCLAERQAGQQAPRGEQQPAQSAQLPVSDAPLQLLQLLLQERDEQREVRAQEREAYQILEARMRALEDPAAGANNPKEEESA
ncbi:hypothetical protein COHA_009755 [Chlorella ohadii]|uniref:Uncharacterized protein n=1 Tax=Chlorella ohadii TaxID=2649997 RepID=A0AAD5DE59_9CHLO|nr:hypothetical protein COHA_009755 [Chlorella ohadii]